MGQSNFVVESSAGLQKFCSSRSKPVVEKRKRRMDHVWSPGDRPWWRFRCWRARTTIIRVKEVLKSWKKLYQRWLAKLAKPGKSILNFRKMLCHYVVGPFFGRLLVSSRWNKIALNVSNEFKWIQPVRFIDHCCPYLKTNVLIWNDKIVVFRMEETGINYILSVCNFVIQVPYSMYYEMLPQGRKGHEWDVKTAL